MIRLRAFMNPASGFTWQFYFYDSEKHAAVEDIVFKPAPPGTIIRPAFELDKGQCQELMDSLWNNGIRPSDGVASTGQIGAMQNQIESIQYHLEDMRRLVFHGKENL